MHGERERDQAKFWLEPVRLESSGGFRPVEIRRIEALVEERRVDLEWAWDEYFGNRA